MIQTKFNSEESEVEQKQFMFGENPRMIVQML